MDDTHSQRNTFPHNNRVRTVSISLVANASKKNRVFEATESLGFPIVQDLNSSANPVLGCAKTQFTIDREGYRNSAFTAFLPIKLVLSRKAHLTICTGTVATKLDIRTSTSGVLQADGVFLRSTSTASKTRYVAARKEVILCCGPLANPQILMLRFG